MRFALTLIAALANAASPWLCCCAMMALTGDAKPAKAPAKTVVKCSNCCEQDNSQSPQTPAPTKPCPCQERLAVVPSLLATATDTVTALDAIATDFRHATGRVELLPTPTLAFANVFELPFMTADTRLRVHHVMHC